MPKNLILNEDEILIRIIRQSTLGLIISLFIPGILIILPFFFLYPLFNRGNWGIGIFFVTLTVGFIWLIINTTIWSKKIFIITNQRIIDVDQEGLFQQTVSDIPLTKIQDIFFQIKGIWQTLSRTGNVNIILIDSKTKIEIKNISQPRKIQQLILQFRDDILKEKLDPTQLSAEELVNLVKKIKAGMGEEKFKEFIKKIDNG